MDHIYIYGGSGSGQIQERSWMLKYWNYVYFILQLCHPQFKLRYTWQYLNAKADIDFRTKHL